MAGSEAAIVLGAGALSVAGVAFADIAIADNAEMNGLGVYVGHKIKGRRLGAQR